MSRLITNGWIIAAACFLPATTGQAQTWYAEDVEVTGKIESLMSIHQLPQTPGGLLHLNLENVLLTGPTNNGGTYTCFSLLNAASGNGVDTEVGVEAKLNMLLAAFSQGKAVTVTYNVTGFFVFPAGVVDLCYVDEVKIAG